MAKSLVLSLLLGVLSGCASTHWVKPGGTGEMAADDQLKCEEFAALRCMHAEEFGIPICKGRQRKACMAQRGWIAQ